MRYLLVVAALLLLALCAPAVVSAAVWQTEIVDSENTVGQYTSIALDGTGAPRIAYWNDTYTMLKYAWHDGAAWQIEIVADPYYTGKYASLRLTPNGSPAIAYRDEWARILRFAWRDEAGWQTEIVDPRSNMGQSASLALAPDGTPRISYNDGPNSWLLYAWRDGTGWHNEVADASLGVGSASSLALSPNGSPRISYHDGLNRDLKYAWNDAAGWHCETVDTPGTVGTRTSLALDAAGRPGIAYWDQTNADLKYAWKNETGWHVETVDASGYVGEDPSLAFDALDRPRIGYYGVGNPSYAWRDAGGWHIASVQTQNWTGEYTSLALDAAGAPFLSYYDHTNGDLKLARGTLPAPAFSADPATDSGPLSVRFTDSSRGEVTSWVWEFGDGATSADRNPVHAYASPGTYTVTLTAGNAAGPTRAARFVTVAGPRLANFTWTPATPAPGETVAFTDTSTGSPRTWEWSFGDGASSLEQHPVHAFASPGNYTVRLTAYFPGSEIGRDVSRTVTVRAPPVANFTASPLNGTAPLSVNFTDTSTGIPENWSWAFGDGATSTARNPAHTFASPGDYTVTLTVGNNAGTNSTARTVTVLEPAPVGGTTAFFLVSTTPAGAQVYLRSIGGDLEPAGNTSAAPLNVTLYLTGTPVTAIVANLTGYADAVCNVTRYPAPGETVAVNLTLVPDVRSVPPGGVLPADTDGDGIFEDVNGNGRKDFADVVLYFNRMSWIAANEPLAAFDCNGNSRIDFADVVWLFNHL